eukprot:2577349-Rhodomonas_salina.1
MIAISIRTPVVILKQTEKALSVISPVCRPLGQSREHVFFSTTHSHPVILSPHNVSLTAAAHLAGQRSVDNHHIQDHSHKQEQQSEIKRHQLEIVPVPSDLNNGL